MKRWFLTAALAAFFAFLLLSVYVRQAVLLLVGIGLGATLAAARFGFTTGWRQLVTERDPSGAAGQLLLLALAALLAMPLLGQYPELQAALGPPSISLIVGAFVIGAIFTPPDVVSQLMLAIPLCLLYELGMLMARFVSNPQAAQPDSDTPAGG